MWPWKRRDRHEPPAPEPETGDARLEALDWDATATERTILAGLVTWAESVADAIDGERVNAQFDFERGSLAIITTTGAFRIAVRDQYAAANIASMTALEPTMVWCEAHGGVVRINAVSATWRYSVSGVPAGG